MFPPFDDVDFSISIHKTRRFKDFRTFIITFSKGEIMFSLDPIIIDFVSGNVLAIALFLGLLKGIAKMTPSVLDDKITTLIGELFGLVPTNKPQ